MPTRIRYALYYAPEPGEDLARFGASWLGRDAESGAALEQPAIDGFAAERLAAITADPRRYGFHGTLKPPFALAAGRNEAALLAAVAAFAEGRAGFDLPPLRLARISGFLALVPGARCAALHDLADDCVRSFDGFRARPGEAELERRRRAGLTPRQETLLRAWGYPYVMEEFRFHLTLTERLAEEESARLQPILAELTAPFTRDPLRIRGIAVFCEKAPGEPFRVLARFPFGRP